MTRSLVTAQIIYQSSQISVGLTYFAYQMHPWAFDHLREHPDLLD